jgi:hypothetical protein
MDSKTVSRVVGRKGDLRDAIFVGFKGLPFDVLGGVEGVEGVDGVESF